MSFDQTVTYETSVSMTTVRDYGKLRLRINQGRHGYNWKQCTVEIDGKDIYDAKDERDATLFITQALLKNGQE